ncbi:MAG TPA: hypothetical protein VFW87_18865 [Pirellulales bacterium]|nr:hypothetical protein [Pirellulales bacterium]
MRALLIATAAVAVGFAVPAMAANSNNGQQGYSGQTYGQQGHSQNYTPSYGQQSDQGHGGWADQGSNAQMGTNDSGQHGWRGQGTNQGSNLGMNMNEQDSQGRQLRQHIRQSLAEGGFTDVRIVPHSFVVHARDRDGNPVMMMITPSSVTALTAVPSNGSRSSGQQYSGNNGSWGGSNSWSGGSSSSLMGSNPMGNSAQSGNAVGSTGNGTSTH